MTRWFLGILGLAGFFTATLATIRAVRANAPVGRYSVSDEVVTDNVTRLIWQRNVDTTDIDAGVGGKYCQSLSLGPLASGWRLPTVKELQSLVDVRGVVGGAIDSALPLDPTGKVTFISATRFVGDLTKTWTVEYGFGRTSLGTSGAVRCVHD